jgi:histone arginine demethylase JMJD6
MDIPDDWPAMKKWSFDYFKEEYGKCMFMISQDIYLKYDYYYHYIKHKNHRKDDIPLYLFDHSFAENNKKTGELLNDYKVPEWFNDDWLSVLGDDARPPFRWIIAGPPRSGSSLHVDPLATGAWNTLIVGRKRWILFPPDTFNEKTEILSSDPGGEWFIRQFPKYKNRKHYDVIQEAGETLFVPPKWWHVTVNIEDSIAITQNYVCESNVEMCKEIFPLKRRKTYFKWLKMMDGKVIDDRNADEIPYDSDLYNSSDSEDE